MDMNAALSSGGLSVDSYPGLEGTSDALTLAAQIGSPATTQQPVNDPYAAYGGLAGYQQAQATQNYYQSQIDRLNSEAGRLDPTLNTGLQNIASAYNKNLNRIDQQNALAKRNYETQDQGNTGNYLQARGGIMSKVRSNANALQRLLGINGSGNSSAAYEQAPYAASLQGSQNLQGAQQVYNTNANTLKRGWEDTQRDYSNVLEDLNQDKYSKENSLRGSIAQTRAGLLDRIAQATSNKALAGGASYQSAMAAQAPYEQQVNSLLDQIVQLGSQYQNPVLRAGNVSYKADPLTGYSLGNNRGVGYSAPGAEGNIDPVFAPVVADQQRDEYGNIIG